jgi:hypothetical protein
MKINAYRKEIVSAIPSGSQRFKIASNSFSFRVLADNIYSHKGLAVIRELLSNAVDAQIEAGIDKPIDINLNTETKHFEIQDYGVGMSHEFVMDSYSSFFESSKRGSNEMTGFLGLGSKTPLIVADSFMLRTCTKDDDKVRVYRVLLNESGVPYITHLGEVAKDEGFNHGTNISFFFKNNESFDDVKTSFHSLPCKIMLAKANVNAKFPEDGFANLVIKNASMVGASNASIVCEPSRSLTKNVINDIVAFTPLFKMDVYFDSPVKIGDRALFVKMGTAVYRVGSISFTGIIPHTILLEVPLGSLTVTPSREAIEMTEANKSFILGEIAKLRNVIKREQWGVLKINPFDYGGYSNSRKIMSWFIAGIEEPARLYPRMISYNCRFKANLAMFSSSNIEREVFIDKENDGYFHIGLRFGHVRPALLDTSIPVFIFSKKAMKNIDKIKEVIIRNLSDSQVSGRVHNVKFKIIETNIIKPIGRTKTRKYRWVKGSREEKPSNDTFYLNDNRNKRSPYNYIKMMLWRSDMKIEDGKFNDIPIVKIIKDDFENVCIRTDTWIRKNDPEGKYNIENAIRDLLLEHDDIFKMVFEFGVRKAYPLRDKHCIMALTHSTSLRIVAEKTERYIIDNLKEFMTKEWTDGKIECAITPVNMGILRRTIGQEHIDKFIKGNYNVQAFKDLIKSIDESIKLIKNQE